MASEQQSWTVVTWLGTGQQDSHVSEETLSFMEILVFSFVFKANLPEPAGFSLIVLWLGSVTTETQTRDWCSTAKTTPLLGKQKDKTELTPVEVKQWPKKLKVQTNYFVERLHCRVSKSQNPDFFFREWGHHSAGIGRTTIQKQGPAGSLFKSAADEPITTAAWELGPSRGQQITTDTTKGSRHSRALAWWLSPTRPQWLNQS